MPKFRVKRHAVTQPLDQSYRLIPLTQGQNAIVDAADFEWLNRWNWCASRDNDVNGFYAYRKERADGKPITMHRIILGCASGELADHANHNTLDNRRENLRKCTSFQNSQNKRLRKDNKSGFRGVSWHHFHKKWVSSITVNRRTITLGTFRNPEEAAKAYDKAAKEYHGEFAQLNFT